MRKLLILAAAALTLSACAAKGPMAEATLAPTKGNTAAGTMSFKQDGANMLIQGMFSGLTPGAHGFHIHEKGDCSAPDGTSAGGHFNPTGAHHGSPAMADHHLGDLPMLTAGADGTAKFEARMSGMTLADGPMSIVKRGVIIHAQADDFTTQPTGNSGGRVACGVIELKK